MAACSESKMAATATTQQSQNSTGEEEARCSHIYQEPLLPRTTENRENYFICRQNVGEHECFVKRIGCFEPKIKGLGFDSQQLFTNRHQHQ